jgi:hypothetical protein
LVDIFLDFEQNSFEKQQAATCHFSKSFVKIHATCKPVERKRFLKIQNRIVCALHVFKRVLLIQKLLVLSG